MMASTVKNGIDRLRNGNQRLRHYIKLIWESQTTEDKNLHRHLRSFKGKLRSKNISPSTEVHRYRISKIVVVWWSFALNFSKSAWKSFKITAFEQRRPPSWRLRMISRLWRSIRQSFYSDDLNLTFNTLKYGALPRCWLQQHVQKRQGKGDLSQRWLAKIKREGKLPKPGNCFVCSDHFTADDFEGDLQVFYFFFHLLRILMKY